MKRFTTITGGYLIALVAAVALAYAWGSTGHRFINLRAVRHLPAQLNTLRADSLFYQTHSTDADTRRNYSDTSFYAEWPRHYIDIDGYPDFKNLTHDLDLMISTYGWERVKQSGVNPWATQWVMDSLTAQFARGDMNKARYTMSDLGHYVADAHQPLHCTANYDGQFTGNDGIHSRYESSMLNLYSASLTILPESVHYVSSALDFAFSYIYISNAHVDSVLQADNYARAASGWNGGGTPPSTYYAALWAKAHGFTQKLIQQATVDLASLWYTAWINAQLINGVAQEPTDLPRTFTLKQNYPNPFNPSTTISYSLEQSASVHLSVFSIDGKEVATLVNTFQYSGEYRVHVDGHALSSGIYYYRLQAGTLFETRKMAYCK